MGNRDKPAFCVVGSPIAHSKSPQIHQLFAGQFGLSISYERVEVRPGELARHVQQFFAGRGRGMNVTVPLKEEAVRVADIVEARAALAGAANTLWPSSDGKVIADNTDGVGLVRDLQRNVGFELSGRRIVLIGAGGAARGVIPALLAERPQRLTVVNRTQARADALVARFRALGAIDTCTVNQIREPCDLIVNATSLSMSGTVPRLPPAIIGQHTLCLDMFYGPTETAFLGWCADHGVAVRRDGLGMLVEQAAVAFAIWHGKEPATAAVIAALRTYA